MIDQTVRQTLWDCRDLLRSCAFRFRNRRALIARLEALLEADGMARAYGDAIVFEARLVAQSLPGVAIDPFEIEVRAHPDGVQVKAWLLIGHDGLASIQSVDPLLDLALTNLDPLVRQAMIMSVQLGLRGGEIAERMGISRRRVRKLLRQGIASVAAMHRSNREPS